MEPLFLKGVLQEKIWGGTKLQDEFGYEIPSETTGELWAISAHPNGTATVVNGEYAGEKLSALWENNRELFGHQEGEVFPLLTKIIDADRDLSVQVHPDDNYALAHEGELGKTECWYVLAAEADAKIIFGHNAKTTEEFKEAIRKGEWTNLLREIPVQAGDFFYVPSGTIHAIGAGVMVLETQQASDTTYRLYDYDRQDEDGNLRDLHLEQSIDVTRIPHEDQQPEVIVHKEKQGIIKQLVSNEFFTVYEWMTDGLVEFQQKAPYTLVSVVDGSGELRAAGQSYPLKKGDHFILPNSIKNWQIDGELQMIASHT